VTAGLVAAGRFPSSRALPHVIASVVGGAVAAAVFYFVLSGAPAGKRNNFVAVSNIYGGGGHFPLVQVFVTEVVITALFLIAIVGVTSKRAPVGFAPIAIGLALACFHRVSIPVSNASLNPARSTATAIFTA
jgi:aquaporin Z